MKLLIILTLAFVLCGGCAMTQELSDLNEKGKALGKKVHKAKEYLDKLETERRLVLEDYKAGAVDFAYVTSNLERIHKLWNEGDAIYTALKDEMAGIKKNIDDLHVPWYKKILAYVVVILGVGGTLAGHGYLGKGNALIRVANVIENFTGGKSDSPDIAKLKAILASLEDKNINSAAAKVDPKSGQRAVKP